jgi:hypothetical protein
MRRLIPFLILFLAAPTAAPSAAAEAGSLKLLISVDSTTITAPFPARLTLHLHNSGKETLWLYTPVRDLSAFSPGYNPFSTEEPGPAATSGGSSLELHLQPANAAAGATESRGEGEVFASVGMPHPKLVALAPGEDYEEKTVVQLAPAKAGEGNAQQLLWGHYKLSVTYRAQYSNAANLKRILGAGLWTDEATSNTVEVDLQPPAADAACSVQGKILGAEMRPALGVVVSLSDQQERVLAQERPGEDGTYSFTHLPVGFYWVTARRLGADEDTTAFHHVELTAAEPAGSVELVLLPSEIHRAERLLHKPVLFRVFDPEDHPLGDVSLDDTWSSGTVLDKMKGRTSDDGTAAFEMIPGRNFLTLRKRGCRKQDERVDVAPGGGLDGFKLVLNCAKR